MANHLPEWWAKRLEELAQGGDADEIAKRYGVRKKTLIWWRSELPRRARGALRKREEKPRLLPVVVRSDAAAARKPSESSIELLIEIGQARMTLRGAVTAEHLAAIVTASARAC